MKRTNSSTVSPLPSVDDQEYATKRVIKRKQKIARKELDEYFTTFFNTLFILGFCKKLR